MSTPANPDDLLAWLRAQLDEIESDARFYLNSGADNGPGMEWAQLVLAEVDAKRRILDAFEAENEYQRHRATAGDISEWAALLNVVKLLALPHADREGFREEWRPA